MTNAEEIASLESCWNKANDGEFLFVLRAKDPAAPGAILHWIEERVRLGLNRLNDDKIKEAFRAAMAMEDQADSGELEEE